MLLRQFVAKLDHWFLVSANEPKYVFRVLTFECAPSKVSRILLDPEIIVLPFEVVESNTLFAKANFFGFITAFHISFLICNKETRVKLFIFTACMYGSKSITRLFMKTTKSLSCCSGNATRYLSTLLTLIIISQQDIIFAGLRYERDKCSIYRILNGNHISSASCSDLMSFITSLRSWNMIYYCSSLATYISFIFQFQERESPFQFRV